MLNYKVSYPAFKLRNVWEEVKKRSDDNVPSFPDSSAAA